jgi:hypothetical protein
MTTLLQHTLRWSGVVVLCGGVVYWWSQQSKLGQPQTASPLAAAAPGAAPAREISGQATFDLALAQLPSDPAEAEPGLREALGEWAISDPIAARNWLTDHGHPDSETQAARQAAVAISWAEQDPAAAANYVQQNIPASLPQNHAFVAVVQRWAQQDGPAAAKFIFQIPDGPVRLNAAAELIAVWADQDTLPPAQWIELLPVSPLRDACTDRLARELATEAPEAAQAWAERIGNAELRAKCLAALAELAL